MLHSRQDEGGPHGDLEPHRIEALILAERVCASLSLFAIAVTVISYLCFAKLRTTPNLFLLFASIANAGASVASMIGYDGLQRGETSALCQFQGFIFEWFMQSDPWWSCAMAVNVFLVFFYNVRTSDLKRYLWAYCAVCFGGPLLPAIVLISIRDPDRGQVFGDAALWCWIRSEWSLVRLYAYYIPIWVSIFVSIVIYIIIGAHVFRKRNQLRSVALLTVTPNQSTKNTPTTPSFPAGAPVSPAQEHHAYDPTQSYGTAVTEVQVTSNANRDNSEDLSPYPLVLSSPTYCNTNASWSGLTGSGTAYSCPPAPGGIETTCSSDRQNQTKASLAKRLRAIKASASLKLKRLDPIKMAYLRTSFIFGFSVLITWTPSSINRLYSISNHGQVSFPLSMASGIVLPLQGVWNAIIYFTTS